MSGFQKVALPLGILVVMSGIAGLVQTHFRKSERKAAFLHPVDGGHFVEAGGVRLRAPIGYLSSIAASGRDVELASEPADFSIREFIQEKARVGKMDFWFQNDIVKGWNGEKMRALMSRRFIEKNFRHVADRPHTLAGMDGICSEYSILYGGEVTYGTRLGIACTFGQDAYAGFEGTLPAAADFYHVIESAQPLKGKN